MGRISVAIATFNEEENIADCLDSIRQLADEVVVVDGDSSDRTAEISQRMRARVIVTKNRQMFHINKNMAIDACRGDWILVLDADERVTSKLSKEMREIADRKWQEGDPNGYFLKRKNLFLTRFLTKGGQYPDPVVRFFRKGKGRHPEVSVHEQVKIIGKVGWLENDLIHLASPNFSRYLMRENRYSSFEAEKMAQKKVKISKFNGFKYLIWRPVFTFLKIFIRHKGYQDGFPGFVFAFFSGLHFILSYIKYWEMSIIKIKPLSL